MSTPTPCRSAARAGGAQPVRPRAGHVHPEIQRIAAQSIEPATLPVTGLLQRLNQAQTVRQLQAALASRAVIDQAIGIIMARRGCGPQEALGVLRRMSDERNVKPRDIAADLVGSLAARDKGSGLPQPRLPGRAP